ncbi:MAG TPA: hypothetical protein VFZ18_13960 [Longimicrobiaceae bacterium]
MTNALAARVLGMDRDLDAAERRERPSAPARGTSGIQTWNARQVRTFQRYVSLYHRPLTPEMISLLARRYAEKHATTRPRLLQELRTY